MTSRIATVGGGGGVGASLAFNLLTAPAPYDFAVISAAVPLTLNASRTVYLRDNAAVVGEVVAALPTGWPGVIVMVTNPVDPLCT